MPTARDELHLLRRVAVATGLRIPEDAQRLQSWSNEAWRCGDVIVRICFLGDPQRLVREAAIGATLPPELRYPRVLDAGASDDISWMLLARVEGESLWQRWKTMPVDVLRPLVRDFANVIRALHSWQPPADLVALLRAHDVGAGSDPQRVTGHDILALPAPRWRPLADAVAAVPFVDAGLIRSVAARLDELSEHDPFAGPASSVVHGDLNFSNVLACDARLAALLDFEWARLGPPDADLVSILRAAGHWAPAPQGYPPVVAWLREDYPGLFAHPNLRERLWMTELAYMLRQLFIVPPPGPPETLDEGHPVRQLARLVDAPWSY